MLFYMIRQTVINAVSQHPHLARWWENFDPAKHETQINVNQMECNRLYQPVPGKSNCWLVPDIAREALGNFHTREDLGEYHTHADGTITMLWESPTFQVANLRIPYGANTNNPTFRDRQVIGSIHQHWYRIGTSGWNWRDKTSEWVGFDFDAICKSKNGHGLTNSELTELCNRVREIPWVTVRTSTGGAGLHFIVPVNRPTTRNHNEHAQLAKYVLENLSKACDFQFSSSVDVYGHILWHYSKGVTHDCLKQID